MMRDDVPLREGETLQPVPWSREAEQSVLGALLLDSEAFDRVGDLVQVQSFFDVRHGAIFGAIAGMASSQKPADVVTVFEALSSAGKAEDCGGLSYLNALAQSVPSAANVRRYAEIVAERAADRKLRMVTDEAAGVAREGSPVAEKIDRIATMFAQLQQTGLRSRPVAAADLLPAQIDYLNALANDEILPGVQTHIQSLNEALGGMAEGKVVVIAARPSIGKSSLAEDLLLHFAKTGHTSLFLSQEMEKRELMERALANLGHVDYSRLQAGKLQDHEWTQVTDAVEQLGRLPLYFDDQPALTLMDIRSKALHLAKQGLRFLVVDYLQLCSGPAGARRENRNTEIEEISRGLKTLAKQMKLTVILLSQLNREVERRAVPEPTLADLRDSGAIEQDADAILFLWPARSEYVPGTPRLIACTLAKGRQSSRAGTRLALEFQGAYQKWFESSEPIKHTTHSPRGSGGFSE
ncbi:replicative DNA helicase [Roseateles toxinivorans]|uniref:DNA 5'-3' helicase n=1 Tax=Roseateles toxinivorans TaxID=270368 RepID=A0A4R6QKR8_9BURK|nr:replicative DNA helicase [Roseateles toxinivorans]TDP63159.1 replicative DNA helicase [Roseateles toxinivorans]